jgi:hypothetical protein
MGSLSLHLPGMIAISLGKLKVARELFTTGLSLLPDSVTPVQI